MRTERSSVPPPRSKELRWWTRKGLMKLGPLPANFAERRVGPEFLPEPHTFERRAQGEGTTSRDIPVIRAGAFHEAVALLFQVTMDLQMMQMVLDEQQRRLMPLQGKPAQHVHLR